MQALPAMMLHLPNPFMPPFSRRVWLDVQVLLPGAFPQPWTGASLVLHYVSWAWGKPGTSSATTASSTVPLGRIGGKSCVAGSRRDSSLLKRRTRGGARPRE